VTRVDRMRSDREVVGAQPVEQAAVEGCALDGPKVGGVVDERVERRDAHRDGHGLPGDLGVVPRLVGLQPRWWLSDLVEVLDLEVASDRVRLGLGRCR
jgi:hypothetical protein